MVIIDIVAAFFIIWIILGVIRFFSVSGGSRSKKPWNKFGDPMGERWETARKVRWEATHAPAHQSGPSSTETAKSPGRPR